MNEDNLKAALAAFTSRRRFRTFLIEFVSGDRLRVTHPEAVYFRKHVLIYQSPQGAFRLFDSESVCQLLDETPAPSP
jgi:hypothetical protein